MKKTFLFFNLVLLTFFTFSCSSDDSADDANDDDSGVVSDDEVGDEDDEGEDPDSDTDLIGFWLITELYEDDVALVLDECDLLDSVEFTPEGEFTNILYDEEAAEAGEVCGVFDTVQYSFIVIGDEIEFESIDELFTGNYSIDGSVLTLTYFDVWDDVNEDDVRTDDELITVKEVYTKQ